MGKRRRIEEVNGEIQLPEAVIQHIQSFLNGKEAAQTILISKSWYSAWSTRPNFDFDQRHFWNPRRYLREGTDGFSEFAKKTMRRYKKLNLNIQSFRLWMSGSYMGKEGYNHSLADKLIVKAILMSATYLHVEFSERVKPFILPQELLGSETLTRLSVINCKIDRGMEGKVSCSRLKSLSLCKVLIEGDTVWDIISSCPLIEKLILSECVCLSKDQTSNVNRTMTKMLALTPPIEFGEQNVEYVVDSLVHLYEFHKLKYLFLKMVEIDGLFFSDFSSKFPCLKDLTVNNCDGYEEIHIFSRTLECISFAEKRVLRAKFYVPRIRKFSFSGSCLPSLSFKTTSKEWESDISIPHGERGTLSLLKLKKFLKKLRRSTISLYLNIGLISEKDFEYTGDVGDLTRPVVENLEMYAPCLVSNALLDGLFWSCCPKIITQYRFPKYRLPKSTVVLSFCNDIVKILCDRLIQQVNQNCYIPNQSMFGQRDLEEVNVEYFEETLAEWQPLPWKTLLDASTSPENEQKVRFQLRWGTVACLN